MGALRPSCRKVKSSHELLHHCPLTSHICPESKLLWEQSPKPKPAVLALRDMPKQGLHVDVIKCRTRAFEHNVYEYPLFVP